MKTKYFEKVENKYVFNISRIFWHIFIVVGSLAIIGGVFLYIYGILPPIKQSVKQESPPTKQVYPTAVTVTLNDLQLEESKKIVNQESQIQTSENEERPPKSVVDNTKKLEKGEKEYLMSLELLTKTLPAIGHYEYYQGNKRLYDYYKDEKYRTWVDDNNLSGRLKFAFESTSAINFIDKKCLVDSIIPELKSFPENKRIIIFNIITSNACKSVTEFTSTFHIALKASSKFPDEERIQSFESLMRFSKFNPNEGKTFIEYVNKVIEKFEIKERSKILFTMIAAHNRYFDNNIAIQTEQTNLFLSMLSNIKPELQALALSKYYQIYIVKNSSRDQTIGQIERQYKEALLQIEEKYQQDSIASEANYYLAKQAKSQLRSTALYGIAFGVGLVSLIAIILVFLSIQRSVRRIEEKITNEIIADKIPT